mgnify:CR=1 FL=1
MSENENVVLCEVRVSKGNENATDAYVVTLNGKCSAVVHVDLAGEE